MSDQIRLFREESNRLLQEILALKESVEPGEAVEDSSVLSIVHEEAVLEEIAHILSSKLSQSVVASTRATTDRITQAVKEAEISSKRKISEFLANNKPALTLPEIAVRDASLASKIELIGNLMKEHFRENSSRMDEILVSEKKRLETEYRKKFDLYKTQMDAYVNEITEKFRNQENEMKSLFNNLTHKLDTIKNHTHNFVPAPVLPAAPTSPTHHLTNGGAAHFARLDEIYAADVPALQAKLRRLWSATEPGNQELLDFLERLERGLFLGERIDKIYEAEIRKCKEKLPVVQAAAKLAFFQAREDPEKIADLEIELARLIRTYEDRWGERIDFARLNHDSRLDEF